MTETDAPAGPDTAPPPTAAPGTAQPAGTAPPNAHLGRRLGPIVLIVCGIVLVAMTVGWIVAQRGVLAGGATSAEITLLRTQLTAAQARITTLAGRVRALAARPAPGATEIAALSQRVAALSQRVATLEARPAGGDTTALAASVTALAQRLASVAQAGQDATQRLARIEAARAALNAGRPLGALPGAPPALARYATTPPPTEAGLRESFAAAATAALAASRPPQPSGLLAGLAQRAESLLTVRVGGKVVAGPPAAIPLDMARRRLDSGDLAGAVAALAPLDAAAAHAMAPWVGRARALLAARAALNDMAAGGNPTGTGAG